LRVTHDIPAPKTELKAIVFDPLGGR
jgi:hypothetical protein